MKEPIKEEKVVVHEKVYKLLEKLVKDGIIEISPVISVDRVSYPLIEEMFGMKSFDEVNEFINILIESGMFKYKLVDKVIRCPKCGSFSILVRYYCPYCGSIDVNRRNIISHIICGELNSIDNFKKGDKLICPKCKKELVKPGVDYKIIGEISECNNCKRKFDMPVITHKCAADNTIFSYREARYVPVYLLTLSEDILESVVKGKHVISVLSNMFENHGFQVSTNSTLQGSSGIEQRFDIIASPKDQNSEHICMDVASNINERDILLMFSKLFDVKSKHGTIVSLNDVSENVKKLASSYNINIISAKGIEDLKGKIKEYIDKLKDKISNKQA